MKDSNLPVSKKNKQSNSEKSEKPLRLQVFLAKCAVASRRASEKFIEDGRVSVNGTIVKTLGTKVFFNDEVLVDGKRVFPEKRKIYILLNKPSGYVCSLSDEKNRPVAIDLIKKSYSERLFNVGRLDMFSRGAVIFTNDGKFAAKISHPSSEIEKEYIVKTNIPIPLDLAENFKKGIRINNIFYRAKDTFKINPRTMKVILIEGKNREIRTVFENSGVPVQNLKRVRIGNLNLNNLKEGEFRELTYNEVSALLQLCKN